MKGNRRYFIVEIDPALQGQMRLAKKSHGINWGFILRNAIVAQLNRVADKVTTD